MIIESSCDITTGRDLMHRFISRTLAVWVVAGKFVTTLEDPNAELFTPY